VKKPSNIEYQRFNDALRQVLQISKSDLNRALAEEKLANTGKPKRGPKPKRSSASDRASGDTEIGDHN
jgi:hypothetical protein